MRNKDFLEFITTKETLPAALKQSVKNDIRLSFRGKSIVAKFLSFQLLGALFSLSVCPQFGLGLVEGHGIAHIFRMMGDWACAVFCGSLFLGSGLLVAFMGMKGEELWWVWQRYKISTILFPAFAWSGLMLTNISLSLPGESVLFHSTWIISGMIVMYGLMKLQGERYLLKVSKNL